MRKLILVTISISRVINNLSDGFFKQKLSLRLFKLIEAYFDFRGSPDVAQYSKGILLLSQLDGLLEDTDYILHSNQSLSTPLLYLKQKTLDLKLSFIQDIKKKRIPKTGESKTINPAAIPKSKLTSNQEKIVDFVKKSNKIRTKDIVEKFNVLSERTIKRTLKDLTESGILKREEKDRAVYYSAPA